MSAGRFCTVINCMDGRTQLQVNEYLRKRFNADFVDTITDPGPIRFFMGSAQSPELDSIFRRVDISVHKHGSRVIGIVAHHDCAGNPVEMKEQMLQESRAVCILEARYPDVKILPLWVNENWEVEEVVRVVE